MEKAPIIKTTATITSIERSPSWTVCFVRCKPEEIFTFQEGQFIMIRSEKVVDENWKQIKRAYSIATTQSELDGKGTIGFIVKQTHTGGMSGYLTQEVSIGDSISIDGPYGHMVNTWTYQKYLLIATGSGLSPILWLYEAIRAKQPDAQVAMLYGERYLNMLLPSVVEIFSKNLVKEKNQEWKIMHSLYLSKEEIVNKEASFRNVWHVQDWLDASVAFLGDGKSEWENTDVQVFICGMPAMVDEVKETLLAKWFSKEQIVFEKY